MKPSYLCTQRVITIVILTCTILCIEKEGETCGGGRERERPASGVSTKIFDPLFPTPNELKDATLHTYCAAGSAPVILTLIGSIPII